MASSQTKQNPETERRKTFLLKLSEWSLFIFSLLTSLAYKLTTSSWRLAVRSHVLLGYRLRRAGIDADTHACRRLRYLKLNEEWEVARCAREELLQIVWVSDDSCDNISGSFPNCAWSKEITLTLTSCKVLSFDITSTSRVPVSCSATMSCYACDFSDLSCVHSLTY